MDTIKFKYKDKNGKVVNTIINVQPFISLENRAMLVREVASLIYGNEAKEGDDYHPYFRKVAIAHGILTGYTDWPMVEDIEDLWFILNTTDLLERVCSKINDVDDLINNIDEYVQYKMARSLQYGNIGDVIEQLSEYAAKATQENEEIE